MNPLDRNTIEVIQMNQTLSAMDQDLLRLHLDLEHLHQLSDDSPEFELELLQMFVEDSYIHLQTLKQAIAVSDLRKIEYAAHHLKGASANVGAKTIQFSAGQLEEQAYQKQLKNPEHLLSELEFSLDRIQEFVSSKI
jgi:HPt (histidine-containing phosphotransfer) domain-containing protein